MKPLLKVAFFAFLGLMVLGALSGEKEEGASDAASRPSVTANDRGFSSTAGAQQATGRSSPELEVLSQKCEREYGYIFVRGEVRNLSGKKLENVMAVGTFRTTDGTLVKTADSLIDYDPLMPGQTSPFSAGTRNNPEITKCYLSFKHFFGTGIDHTVREARQQPDPAETEAVLGLTPAQRREVQQTLAALGYNPGGVDGVFGPRTRHAIAAWQRAAGLTEVTGYLAEDHYAWLLADAGSELATADLSRTGCGRVQAVRGDDGALQVVGYRVKGDGAGGAAPVEGGGVEDFHRQEIDVSLVELAPSLCRVLNVLAEHEPKRDEGIGVVLRNERSPEAQDTFEDQDFLMIELPAADEPRYVALDYFHEDIVLHLYPPGGGPAPGPVPPGQPLRLGEPVPGERAWRIASPFGRDLFVAFVSARPLYKGRRPEVENTKDYLAFLRRRLAYAAPGDNIRYAHVVVTTVPKGVEAPMISGEATSSRRLKRE